MTSMFSPFDLPEGITLLITDALSAPANFLLHRTLAAHLKKDRKDVVKCVVLSVSKDITRWKAIAAKSNFNLQHCLDSGSVEFVDVLAHVQPQPSLDGPNLRPIYDRVQACMSKSKDKSMLVILDDITLLEWIGFPLIDIIHFSRALRALCQKFNATLLIRHHLVNPGDPDDLYRHLLQICTYHMEVQPLASGRSGTVTGEISLHLGVSGKPDRVATLIPRSNSLQYRLTESGPDFFERGTSESVL